MNTRNKVKLACIIFIPLIFIFPAFFAEKEPELSVIVPVYNSEQYISACLDSLTNQTYKNIEIICVNDGSEDNSLEKLRQYKQIDPRIIVIDKKNGGVSSARNLGMLASHGKYITFIDSDDYLDLDLYEKCMDKIKSLDADVLAFGLMFEPAHTYGTVVSDKTYTDPFYVLEHDCVNCSVCNRIFRRSIISDNNILFKEDVKYGEDNLFLMMVLPHAKVLTNQPGVYYHYLQQGGSIEHTFDVEKRLISAINRCKYSIEYYRKNNYSEEYGWLLQRCLDITYWRIKELDDNSKKSNYSKKVLDILENQLLHELEFIPEYEQNQLNELKSYAKL